MIVHAIVLLLWWSCGWSKAVYAIRWNLEHSLAHGEYSTTASAYA